MFVYDRFNNIIMAGDILKFDNDKCYLVLRSREKLVMQDIYQYSPPLNLKLFVKKNNKVAAERICNISNYI